MGALHGFLDDGAHGQAPVNPWSLRKSPRIKRLLLQLTARLGRDGWRIDTQARISDDAVYLVHPLDGELRAYLHLHGQEAGRAGIYLEYPGVDGRSPVYETFDGLALPRLADMLAAHFGICPPGAA